MSKAKVKVSVKQKTGQGGNLLARVPLSIEKNAKPSGEKMYQTKAQVTIRPKKAKGGRARVSVGH